MSTTRSLNMDKRRQRILLEARNIIANKGADALNLRDLAAASEVTVPTIYNLIGNKNKLLEALLLESIERFKQQLKSSNGLTVSERATIIADSILIVFGEDPDYYRTMGIAGEKMDNQYDIHGPTGVMRPHLVEIIESGCQNAIDAGELRGNASARLLGETILAGLQSTFRDWIYGAISLEEFRSFYLKGHCLVMAADASPDYREKLFEIIEAENAKQ